MFLSLKDKGTGAPAGYVLLNEKKYMIHAQVHTLSGYSAHAGKKDLINFVKRMRIKPTEIRIIHGDEGAKASLKLAYDAMLDDTNVMIPHF
ncbi:MAG: metallo-beta-lactamase family protein [Oleiphilaceae bacterium]